jgi:hypothetical protein
LICIHTHIMALSPVGPRSSPIAQAGKRIAAALSEVAARPRLGLVSLVGNVDGPRPPRDLFGALDAHLKEHEIK